MSANSFISEEMVLRGFFELALSSPPPALAFPTSLLNNPLFTVHSPSLKWKELALLLMIIFKLQNFNSISVANKWKLCILFNVFQKIPAIFFL